jgi:hypothetical protein
MLWPNTEPVHTARAKGTRSGPLAAVGARHLLELHILLDQHSQVNLCNLFGQVLDH